MKRIYFFAKTLALVLATQVCYSQMNWVELNTGTTKNIRDISFISDSVGFISGDAGLLKMTTDGGVSWTDITIPSAGQGTGNNDNIKIAQFYDYGGNIGGVLFFDKFISVNRTYNLLVDGWMEECGPGVISYQDSICSVNGFWHNDSFDQYTVGSSCENGGGDFGYFGGFCFAFDSLHPQPGFAGWNDIIMTHSNKLISVGASGRYNNFQLFGSRSNHQVVDTNFALVSIDQSDSTEIYAVNDNVWWSLFKSTDDGVSFEVDSSFQPTFYYPVFSEIDFTDNDWGVMVGLSNISEGIIITKKGNWYDYFITDTLMTSVWVVDSTVAYAGGLGGKLFKYEKGGTLSISEPTNSSIDFNLFPNPAQTTDVLTIQSNEDIKQVEVFDINGRLILNRRFSLGGQVTIRNVFNCSGLYFVKVRTNKGVGTKKVVIN